MRKAFKYRIDPSDAQVVKMEQSVRCHKCPFRGLELQRDFNAALNILARGISFLLAAGLVVTAPGGLALAGPMKGEPSQS